MRKAILAAITSLIIAAPGFAQNASQIVPQQGYTTNTLSQPIYEVPELVVEATALNNWLNINYKNLTPAQMIGPREHLYYLINSYIKHLYTKDGIILPAESDLVLESLFYWSEQLAVFGGSQIFNAVKSADRPNMPELMQVPEPFVLSLEGDLFEIESKTEGWSVTFPYYFMVSTISDFTAKNGMRTQLISLSTGSAVDESPAGKSQATLMLAYSPGANIDDFSGFWLGNLGFVEPAKTKSLNGGARSSFYSYSTETLLHTEISIWEEPNGVFAVVYMGIDGTYQWNRPHFLDFVRALEVVDAVSESGV